MSAGLTAQEGWVFSRVDGHTSFAELFHITGLGEPQTVEILKSLVQRGLVLTKNGAKPVSPAAGKITQPIAKPTTLPPQGRVPTPVPARLPTPSPPSAPQNEVDRARAEVAAADEALASATRAREKAAAEEANANAAFAKHREGMDNADREWKQIEARREAARMAEEQARASVQALRDSLVRAEMELTKTAAERERIFRETDTHSKSASDVRGQAGQAAAYSDLATKARVLAEKDEEAAKGRVQDAGEAMRAAEERAHTAGEDAKRRAAEEAVRTSAEKQRAAARDLENLVKGYTTDEGLQAPGSRPQAAPDPKPGARSLEPGARGLEPDAGDSDLPDEARKRIMRKHVKLATQDLFELLDLPIECDKRDVKRAYFKLSKEFHPDRFFGKKLGAYKDMVAEVFRSISQAAEFLGDDAKREEYRAMIHSQREMKDLEESFAKATAAALEEQQTAVAVAQNAEAAPAGPAPEQSSPGFAATPAEARASGSGKWARKGSGEYPVSSSVTPPVKPPSGSRLVQKMLSKKLGGGGGDGGAKARKHFEEGNRQEEQEQWVSAMHNYKLAVTLAPGNAEYENKYIEAQARAAEVQAAAHAKRAEFEKSAGRFDTAARCYEAAIDAFATWEWCVDAVEMFLQIRELNKALEYGIKAVELDSASASAHLALGRVYRERKQLIDAKRAIERAISLDPQSQEARELLKEVGKSA